MSVFNVGADIFHNQGSRLIWSTTSRPVLLLPAEKKTVPLDIGWPDLSKANIYGYNRAGENTYAGAGFISARPQEWDSGLTDVTSIPAGCNYFQVDIIMGRLTTPSQWLGNVIPMLLPADRWQTLDGASALAERIGPLLRMFRFERDGNLIKLRRKQSVQNAGRQFPFLSNNNPQNENGGQRNGWTWGGDGEFSHACSLRATTNSSLGNRGQSGMASVEDNTNYTSVWRGTVVITPGYIK